jgi:methionine-rich copper-binding protein CopC
MFLIAGVSAAGAKPVLERTSPVAGSNVRHAPTQILLSFTEVLVPSASEAVVRNASGAVVSSGKSRVVGNKAQLQVPVNALSPGKYRVEWYATSSDKNHNQGSFNFVVGGEKGEKNTRKERRHTVGSRAR